MAWKPDIIRLWKFPKEMKEFTIDQQKNMIAFSGSHFRLPLLLRVSDKRVEPLPESEYSAPLRFQLPISLHATISSGLTVAIRWHNSGLRNWHSPPTGVSRKGSLAVSKLFSMLTNNMAGQNGI
ncbi:Phosphoglycerol transferase I [Escherichia coli]|uniref:Phosphoglycerol transferase I n=1 Tax=Escherichia coli TaxID=562 RepID=A0A377ARQ6_ECOLX|nr:Phosphoglycerol transferase I [Escherichia coli]